jgi:hypothetical protein
MNLPIPLLRRYPSSSVFPQLCGFDVHRGRLYSSLQYDEVLHMTTAEKLYDRVRLLPESLALAVLDYVEFLLGRASGQSPGTSATAPA